MAQLSTPARQADAIPRPRIVFDRNELAGALGDIGTDLPLLVGMVLAAGLDGASVLVMFGAMQVLSGLVYRLPMAVQPLKAMAAIVIAQQAHAEVLYGAGLAIGIVMLLLASTGLLDWLGRVVPQCVVRGIQLGLGLQLAGVALEKFIPADGASGYLLATVAFVIAAWLFGSRRFPAALAVVALGLAYAAFWRAEGGSVPRIALHMPAPHVPRPSDVLTGLLVLALPQIPLSLGNSVLATRQLVSDLFPDRAFSIRKIGLTYALMNLINPWLGGVPTCHGSGGLAGHYTFGGRTGGSVILYGAMLLAGGLFFGDQFSLVIRIFPWPILGVILLFEALALIGLVRDTAASPREFSTATLVGLLAVELPYGYAIALVAGTVLVHFGKRFSLVSPHSLGDDDRAMTPPRDLHDPAGTSGRDVLIERQSLSRSCES